jgi:hypothetical protein
MNAPVIKKCGERKAGPVAQLHIEQVSKAVTGVPAAANGPQVPDFGRITEDPDAAEVRLDFSYALNVKIIVDKPLPVSQNCYRFVQLGKGNSLTGPSRIKLFLLTE